MFKPKELLRQLRHLQRITQTTVALAKDYSDNCDTRRIKLDTERQGGEE